MEVTDDRRDSILIAARQLFADKGYEGTTMDEIAAAAGVSKATLYRYLPGKQALRDLVAPHLPEADLQIRDVRTRVLEAAMDTIGRKGYSRTTLDDIAAAAGISKGGIYWHFRGKDDLMAAIVAELSAVPHVMGIVEASDGMPFEEVMRQIYDALLDFLDRHGDFFFAIISEMRGNEELGAVFQRQIAQPLLGVLGAYLADQASRANLRPVHPIVLLQALMGPLALHMILRPVAEHRLGLRLDRTEVRDTLLSIFLDGIRSNPLERPRVEFIRSAQEADHADTGG